MLSSIKSIWSFGEASAENVSLSTGSSNVRATCKLMVQIMTAFLKVILSKTMSYNQEVTKLDKLVKVRVNSEARLYSEKIMGRGRRFVFTHFLSV